VIHKALKGIRRPGELEETGHGGKCFRPQKRSKITECSEMDAIATGVGQERTPNLVEKGEAGKPFKGIENGKECRVAT